MYVKTRALRMLSFVIVLIMLSVPMSGNASAEGELPANLTAVAGNVQVSLSWDHVPEALGYRLNRDNGTGLAFLVTVGTNAYVDHDVVNGITYQYQVTAFNGTTDLGNSTIVTATPGTVPSPVSYFSLTNGSAAVTLNWTAPMDDGGSAILGYRVYRELMGTIALLSTINATEFTDTSVFPGLSHIYWVVPLNVWGAGPPSERLNATPPLPPLPDIPAPTYLLAYVGDAQVTLNWDPMDGLPIDGFRVFRSEGGELTILANVTTSSYLDSNVTNGVTYTYLVRCFFGGSEGLNRTVTATPGTVPAAPVLALQSAADRVLLSWSVPNDGGSDVLGYRVYRTPGTGSAILLAMVTGTGYTDRAVVLGVNYTYTVTALNAFGEGLPSNAERGSANGVIEVPSDVPAKPYLASVTAAQGNITITWNAPDDTGDAPLIGFNIYRGSSALTRQLLVSVPAATTMFIDSAVSAGSTYYYWVSATNQWGEGETSRMLSVTVTAAVAPGVPGDIEATPGQGRVVLTWSAPEAGGSEPISGYRIYRAIAGADRELLTTVPAESNSFVDAAVDPDVEYHYWVVAVSAAGEGEMPSEAVSAVAGAVLVDEVEGASELPGLIGLMLGAIGLILAIVAIVLVLRRK